MVAQAVGQKATLRGARLRKQVPNQDDPGRVDVVYPPKLSMMAPGSLASASA